MSGGRFSYDQCRIDYIIDEIKQIIRDDLELDAMDRRYSAATIRRFSEAINVLRRARVYAHRIDWLVSGDDGEDRFHQRLERELAELAEESE